MAEGMRMWRCREFIQLHVPAARFGGRSYSSVVTDHGSSVGTRVFSYSAMSRDTMVRPCSSAVAAMIRSGCENDVAHGHARAPRLALDPAMRRGLHGGDKGCAGEIALRAPEIFRRNFP